MHCLFFTAGSTLGFFIPASPESCNSVCYNVTMTTVSRGSRKFSVALGDHTITDVVHRSPKPCYVVCECAWLEVRLCLLCAVAVCVNG